MNIVIEHIPPELAQNLCRTITADLPEYFGLPEINEHYAIGMLTRHSLAAKIDGQYVGLLTLEFPYPTNSNIYWMGIMRKFHGNGIGKDLMLAANAYAIAKGASSMTVETLAPLESDENYLKTYKFYGTCGFKPLFNLKPGGYEWNMVYMVKQLDKPKLASEHISINLLRSSDIPVIVNAFAVNNWPKPASIFEGYLQEQQANKRLVWVACIDNQFAGYVTLKWQSQYAFFASNDIPEIMDLNVLPEFRNQGIGSKLLNIAEQVASTRSDIVGIGVGLYGGADGGYGSAQKLYVNRGYSPDGRGVTYNYKSATPGDSFPLDDESCSMVYQKTLDKQKLPLDLHVT